MDKSPLSPGMNSVGTTSENGQTKDFGVNQGKTHKAKPIEREPYANNTITKIDGVNAYSQAQSLYKGEGKLGTFIPQPGLDVSVGKMPAGMFHPYPYQRVESGKLGFDEYIVTKGADFIPPISPEATGGYNNTKTTTNDASVHTTWRDLFRELETGRGSRTNKYLLEMSIPLHERPHPMKLNVLCQATSLPARNVNVASVWRFGRKYNLRAETDFGGSWTLTFLDDSNMTLRKTFERWAMDIDDSKLQDEALDGIYDDFLQRLSFNIKDRIPREENTAYDFNGLMRELYQQERKEYRRSLPRYQTDIRVYQLDQVGNKVLGFTLQNAFVSSISQIDYADEQQNELVKFQVTLTFSEFVVNMDRTLDPPVRVFNHYITDSGVSGRGFDGPFYQETTPDYYEQSKTSTR